MLFLLVLIMPGIPPTGLVPSHSNVLRFPVFNQMERYVNGASFVTFNSIIIS